MKIVIFAYRFWYGICTSYFKMKEYIFLLGGRRLNMVKIELFNWLDENAGLLKHIAQKIWDNPETAYNESFASKLQASVLQEAGFKIKMDLERLPTAFIAEYGEGKPVIGVLGEYDALSGLSQKKSSKREPVEIGGTGHGCGHNLLGTAGLGAVLAIKKAIDTGQIKGTVRYYGCPAEEMSGKVFMASLGVFHDLDACFSWHPASMNVVWGCSFLAVNSVKFNFKGISAHASAAPHLGRSALDGVELMNVGANYLREHIDEKARIHYTITNGGGKPNIVPAEASVWYYIRAPKRTQVEEIYERLVKIAKGAAMMTGTEVDVEFLGGCHDVLPNEILGEIMHINMLEVGPPQYTEKDRKFAEELAESFEPGQKEKIMKTYFAPEDVIEMTLHEGIAKVDDKNEIMAGSTDIGDVSWIVPFAQITAAAWPVGTAAHSWQSCASSGSGIGYSAMMFAAKTMAGALYDLFMDEGTILNKAKEEFENKTKNNKYKSFIPTGERPPSH